MIDKIKNMSAEAKMTSVGIVAMGVLIVFLCFCIRTCGQCVDQAGGFRQIVVDTGKEVKSIYKDINTDEHTD